MQKPKSYNAYRKDKREAAAKWFKEKRRQTPKTRPYCLDDRSNWWNNIILTEVKEYVEKKKEEAKKDKKPFALHMWVHHGLSSQAMLFNLIGPMITREDYAPLRDALKKEKVKWPDKPIEPELEYSDRDVFGEGNSQPTSIDLAINPDEDGIKLFIEAKFTENNFGACSVFRDGNCAGGNPLKNQHRPCYLEDEKKRTYWELMRKHKLNETGLAGGEICPFINFYQFYRLLLFALEKQGTFIFLYDHQNPAVSDQWKFLKESLNDEHRRHIAEVTIQDVLKKIKPGSVHNDWAESFKKKYGFA